MKSWEASPKIQISPARAKWGPPGVGKPRQRWPDWVLEYPNKKPDDMSRKACKERSGGSSQGGDQ